MKTCSKCKVEKELDCFPVANKKKDGRQGYCKLCFRSYRLDPANHENIEKNKKNYYVKNKVSIIKTINRYNKNRDEGLASYYWTMIRRCKYPSQYGYRWYGALGIKVEWKSYKDFKKDMYESYLEHLAIHGHKETTIDRIDSRGNYSKDNCRWATWEIQHLNKTKRMVK